jgi:hypothetical protein
MSLLTMAHDAAISKNKRLEVSDELIELAIAWVKREVTDRQVIAAIHGEGAIKSGNHLYPMARALRAAYDKGLIKEAI